MQPFDEPKDCFGCGSCAAACLHKAISMQPDSEGFARPNIDADLCTGCGLCAKVCPAKTPLPRSKGRFFAVRCRDADLLQKSSSGGAFSLIADAILADRGLVCGACFDTDFRVIHRISTDLAPMRKSKYVQSDLSDCLISIQDALASGQSVLFSGTPCQCHGLLAFLGRKPAGLRLISLVCRGAASPGLWKDYVRWLEGNGTLTQFDFRDKRRANDGHTVSYTIDGLETAVLAHQDGFSRLYNLGLSYRPCCYQCPYCSPDNDFDFTIGDFWGIEKIQPRLADGRGVSLVVTHGQWAGDLIDALSHKAEIFPCTRENALQPALLAPAKEPLLRRFLFRDFARKDDAACCNIPLILKKYAGFSL